MRQHDSDLCERIRKLEERVRELEARPPVTIVPSVYPPYYVPSTPIYYPWTVWCGSTVGVGTNDTVTLPDGTSTTYTVQG